MDYQILHNDLKCYDAECKSDYNYITYLDNVVSVYCKLHLTCKKYKLTNSLEYIGIENIKPSVYSELSFQTHTHTNQLMRNRTKIDTSKFTTECIYFFTVSNDYLCLFLYNNIIHIYNIHIYTIDKPIAVFRTFVAKPEYVSIYTNDNVLIVFTSNTLTLYDTKNNIVLHNAGNTDISGAPYTHIHFSNEITSSCMVSNNSLLAICERTIYYIDFQKIKPIEPT